MLFIFVDAVILCTQFTTQVTEYLIVATPHKRPHITPAMGFELVDEVVKERVRVRLYKSICQLPPLTPAASDDKGAGDLAADGGEKSGVADDETSGVADGETSGVGDDNTDGIVGDEMGDTVGTASSDATVAVHTDR